MPVLRKVCNCIEKIRHEDILMQANELIWHEENGEIIWDGGTIWGISFFDLVQ